VGVTSVNSLRITVLVPMYLSHCSKDFSPNLWTVYMHATFHKFSMWSSLALY